MATGQLVPHTLPDGRTVMVPDYLAPQALALPNAQAPSGPDERLALNTAPTDPGKWGTGIPSLPAPTQAEKAADFRSQLLAQQPEAPGPADHGSASKDPGWMPSGKGVKAAPKTPGVDPASLATRRPQAQQSEGGGQGGADMDPLVRRVFNEGGGGGGPRRDPGLVVGSIKQEREPGKELLPEYKWELGLEKRPDLGRELDPDAEQPTWGNADPITRERKTGLERGADTVQAMAEKDFASQEIARQEHANAVKFALAQQSEGLDNQLNVIADRRNRIATLQATADKRQEEANSMEPRTREQVWSSKGGLAQVAGYLAMAIGGYAQGLGVNGAHNPGLEMINKMLDSAVDDERYKSERRQKVGLKAQNDYERAMALYGDPEMAALDTKNRKLASVIAMTDQMANDRALDATAKQRAAAYGQQARQQFYAGKQQIFDMGADKLNKEEINYKPGTPTGGGGDRDTLARLERAARAKKAEDTITGADSKPKANPTEQAALNEEEADMLPLKELLGKYRNSDSIPGVGGRNVASRGVRGALNFVAGEGAGSRALDSDEERANRIVLDRTRLAYRHKVTGAGGSDAEAERIDEAFAAARTKHDLQVAADMADKVLAERRRLSAGGTPTSTQRHQRAASEESGQ